MPFLASLVLVSFSVIAAIMPSIEMPGLTNGGKPPFPAPPGYLLPWAGGELHTVSQGEETTLTHNGTAAYAFDFDLTYDAVVAARAGKVTMVRQDSNVGGCGAIFAPSANYVVVDHGDGTSGLYLHLAQNSVAVRVGDLVDQGQLLALSGETGLTCSDSDSGPGPHLHFQVERTEENRYFSQSLPIAFDEIAKDDGVPKTGQTYVSGNYGRAKAQKIRLTPHRNARAFNPVARPANPGLLEADAAPVPTPTEDVPTPSVDDAAAVDVATATAEVTRTPRPTRTPTITPSDTPERAPSDTPVPAAVEATATLAAATATPSVEPSSTASPSATVGP